MSNKQQPPLPTLKPGDSHMESLIEAAIQGHADTRDAMRWLVRQLVPATQPAEVTDEQIRALIPEGDGWKFDVGFDEAIFFARAILALRPVQVPMTDAQPYPYAPEPKRRMLPGRYIIRKNDDGEFGQVTGWLYRDEGPDCIASGAPIYVWRPLSDLIGQKPSAEPMNREAAWEASPTNSDWEAVDAYMQGIADAESHHGITAQAKKETP